MNRSPLEPRLWYVAGATAAAAIVAVLIGDDFSLSVLAMIIVPTALVAGAASLALITHDGVAGFFRWLLAGLLVPILSVVVSVEMSYVIRWLLWGSRIPRDHLHWATITVGAFMTIPIGVAASVGLLWIIRKRFYDSDIGKPGDLQSR